MTGKVEVKNKYPKQDLSAKSTVVDVFEHSMKNADNGNDSGAFMWHFTAAKQMSEAQCGFHMAMNTDMQTILIEALRSQFNPRISQS